jgi:hypothetical protein
MSEHDQLTVEIARVAELTKAGTVKWEKVPGKYCTYQTTGETQPRLEVSCCKPECYVEVSGKRVDVSCEDLIVLCAEIIQQIRRSQEQTAEVVSLMRTINPDTKGGAA